MHPIVTKCKGFLHIYDPIFTRNLFVFAGMSKDKFLKTAKAGLSKDFDRPRGDGHFYAYELTSGEHIGVVWSRDRNRFLRHEMLHASLWILDEIGVSSINKDNEEVLTYHTDFLCQCVVTANKKPAKGKP